MEQVYTMSMLAAVTAGIIADKSTEAVKNARKRKQEIQRSDRFSSELGPIATEFNEIIGDRLANQAETIDSDELHSIAVNWEVIAGDINTTKHLFENESDAIDWITSQIIDHEDVNLGEEAKSELQDILTEEYANAIEHFKERIANDENLRTHFQTTLDLDLYHQFQEMQAAFDRLANREPYTLYRFPDEREAFLETFLHEEPVEFVDRAELDETPSIDRYFVLAPSGAGKSRLIAEWVRRLPEDAISHLMVPDGRLLDPMDTRRLASHDFEGDLLLIWEDIHRVDENADNEILERTLRELDHGLQSQGFDLNTLLEARSGKLDDIPGNLPGDFNNEKSLWSQYEPIFVNELDVTRLQTMADKMASNYDIRLHEDARDTLVEKIQHSKSAPKYIETAIFTSEDELSVEDIDQLASDVKSLWQQQYASLKSESPSEWKVLVAMKLLWELCGYSYSKLVRTVFVEVLDGDRDQFRPAVDDLQDRQWLTVNGDDQVSIDTWYYMHATQVEAIQAKVKDDLHRLSELLVEKVDITVPKEQRPDVHAEAAKTLLNMERFNMMQTHANIACELATDSARVYNLRAIAKSRTGDMSGAEEDYSKAITLSENDPTVYVNRAYLRFEQEMFNASIQDLDQAIEFGSENPDSYYKRGWAKIKQSEYQEAIEDLNKAIERDPENDVYYFRRAYAKYEASSFEDAIGDYDTAIELNNDEAAYYIERANAKSKLGELEEALTDYNLGIAINDSEASYYRHRGWAKYENNDPEDALQDYNKAIELDPDNPHYFAERGEIFESVESDELAFDDYSESIRLAPDNAHFYHYRGKHLLRTLEYERAIEDYDTAIELDPGNPELYIKRAQIYSNLLEYEQAIEDYTNAIDLENDNPQYYFNRGNVHRNLDNFEQAIDDYTKAIEIDSNRAEFYSNRARTYAKLGEYKKGISDYDVAIEIDPENPWYVFSKGKIFEVRGNIETARENYRRAIETYSGPVPSSPRDGWTELAVSEYEHAITNSEEAVDDDLDSVDCYHTLGRAKSECGDYSSAIECFSQQIDIDPEKIDSYYNRGLAKIAIKNYDGAIADLTQTIQMSEYFYVAREFRGLAYIAKGQYQEGMEDLNQSISRTDITFGLFICRAVAHLIDGNIDTAEDFINKLPERATTSEERILSVFYKLVIKLVQDQNIAKIENRYRSLCTDELITMMTTAHIEVFLPEITQDASKQEKIKNLISVNPFRQNKTLE